MGTVFCDFCECFIQSADYMSDRCKKCHDRIYAELQQETVEAITLSMEALMKRHRMETEAGLMTEKQYKSDMKNYHDQRIQIETILGNLPEKKHKKKFRNGLYI